MSQVCVRACGTSERADFHVQESFWMCFLCNIDRNAKMGPCAGRECGMEDHVRWATFSPPLVVFLQEQFSGHTHSSSASTKPPLSPWLILTTLIPVMFIKPECVKCRVGGRKRNDENGKRRAREREERGREGERGRRPCLLRLLRRRLVLIYPPFLFLLLVLLGDLRVCEASEL